MEGKLQGIFTPLLVPYDSRGAINERELRRLIAWILGNGIHGLFPNGSTGEATRLTQEERQRIVEITCDEAGRMVPVVAGIAEANVGECLLACDRYRQLGARAVAVLPPLNYPVSQDSVYTYLAEIARHSPIDVLLYNMPAFANRIELASAEKLAEFPRVIGIKDSSGDLLGMMRLIASIRTKRPDFSFLTGWEPLLVPMLQVGCDGAASASGNVVPGYLRCMFDLVRADKVEAALEMQYRFLPLFDTIFQGFEFPDGFRVGAECKGFSFGVVRQPLPSAQAEQRDMRRRSISALLAELEILENDSAAAPRTTADNAGSA